MTGKLVIMQGPASPEKAATVAGLLELYPDAIAVGSLGGAEKLLRDGKTSLVIYDPAEDAAVTEIEVRFFGGVSEEGPRVTEFEA